MAKRVTLGNYVGGEWRGARSGETYEKRNPMRPDEVVGEFPACDARDVEDAVAAAQEAFPAWARTPAPQRGNLLVKVAEVIDGRVEQIAADMTREMGKPLRESRVEAGRASTILRFFGGEGYRPVGELFEQSVSGGQILTRRRPLGVVGLITPWNFPAAIPIWKSAPALAYGNTVVIKLAWDSPLTGPAARECFDEAGLPAGRPQRDHGEGLDGRRGAGPRPARAGRVVHRLGRRRPRRARRGDAARQARPARARRPQPADRPRRREARRRRRGRLRGRLLVRRPEVHGDAADVRRGRRLRRLPGRSCSTGSPRQGRATRPIPKPRSARLSTRRSSTRSCCAAIDRGRQEGGTVIAGGAAGTIRRLRDRADGVRGRARRRVPLVRGGLRSRHLALPGRRPRRGAPACKCRRVRPLGRDLHARTSQPSSASRPRRRPASCTSTRRPRAPRCTYRSEASNRRAADRTSRVVRRSSSTPRWSRSTRTSELKRRRETRGSQRQQGAVGEGRLHAHRREHARERRGARASARDHRGHRGARSRVRRRDDRRSGGRNSAPNVLGVDIARNLVEAGNRRARGGPDQLPVPGGRRLRPARARRRHRSTSSSASSARCSRRSRSTWPRRWCA